MPRFFLPNDYELDPATCLAGTITLGGEDAAHLSLSLRARVGDSVTLCTRTAFEIRCRILSFGISKKEPLVTLQPLSIAPSVNESPVKTTLFQGLPKGKKTDLIVQKATELGAARIVFVRTDHAVPEEMSDSKCVRLNKIAEEAAKQSGRGLIPVVSFCDATESAIEEMKESAFSFYCDENGGVSPKTLVKTGVPSASFFIGPEGGISERERALFQKAVIPAISLGRRILRTETAPLAVLSFLNYAWEW